MAYQTIADKKGSSNSAAKLAKIKLPRDMRGMRFLDIGCSQGFFCREARQRGARHVVGVDHDASSLETARALDADGVYVQGDWYTSLEQLVKSDEKFDVIIHLSAFHYVSDHIRFLALVHQLLAPDGLFVLECGLAGGAGGPRYVNHRRAGITLPYVRHVSLPLLDQLLCNFAYRSEGRSVDQPGDSLPRNVFHCHLKKPIALIVGADSGFGKSVLAKRIGGARSVGNIKIDYILQNLATCPIASVEAAVNEHMLKYKTISNLSESIVAHSSPQAFANAVADLLPACFDLLVVEGEVFVDKRLKHALANELIRRGFVCWGTDRLLPDGYAESGIGVMSSDQVDISRFLLSDASTPTLRQSARERDIRIRPADNMIWLAPCTRNSKLPTAVAWRASAARQFGAFVRIVGMSRPVEFVFEALRSADLAPNGVLPDGSNAFAPAAPIASEIAIVSSDEPYRRVQLDIPAVEGETILRVTCRMADPEVKEARAYGYLTEPYFTPAH